MHNNDFHQQTRADFLAFLTQQESRFPTENRLRIDLHCHDHHSDVPDELWGRLLKLPETWLPTDQLVKHLQSTGTDLITITNHNNARSCWELMDKGMDVLSGAEFTCHFPDESLSVHVLVYGFSPQQESRLNRLRHNIYHFVAYTLEQDLPSVLPHPLFFYSAKNKLGIEALEKLALLFERFEVLNGQRGFWQNRMTQLWIESLTEEKLHHLAIKHKINPHDFCVHPFNKCMTGGSDDHNGIFAGECGSFLYVDNLAERRKSEPLSALALEALRAGYIAPYGQPGEEERLTTTFLDYFSQVAIHMKDPGLLRLMLHKGSLKDKLMCLGVSNTMQELQRHKYTLAFLKTFHQALGGKSPALLANLGVPKEFKPTLKIIKQIAKTRRKEPENFSLKLRKSIPSLYREVTGIFFQRLSEALDQNKPRSKRLSLDSLIKEFELPTHLRGLVQNSSSEHSPQMLKILESLTFPALAALVIGGASFTGSQVLYANRELLNDLAKDLNAGQHSERILWLTDSFCDGNGVSGFLNNLLDEVQQRQLPIDLLTCHPTLAEQPHLNVLRPISQFHLKQPNEQTLYVPDMLEVQRVFEQGGYDRIICSTELMMGVVALYLKHAFSVPVWFYMHTDWHEYFQRSTALSAQYTDRFRRLLRAFYHQFDGLFVLNREHRDWLASEAMEIPIEKLHLTAHWVNSSYHALSDQRNLPKPNPTLLYAGRISREKGVLDLPEIFRWVRKAIPNIHIRIAGNGPALKKLRRQLPEAEYLGWIDEDGMKQAYLEADMLLLPSRFDTFGCVVLEALATGLPVAAYHSKGPADIIQHGQQGFLSDSPTQMAAQILHYFSSPMLEQKRIQRAAKDRLNDYQAEQILNQLLTNTGIHLTTTEQDTALNYVS
ncbi:MAG: glycosyltransferase [Oceanospirillales bacterium]|nr:MAG: glycosyltransferase [Oceanospirillales bacterium]